MVFAFDVFQVKCTSRIAVIRPIQLNSAALYCAPGERSASSSAAVWVMTPSAVPSFGAAGEQEIGGAQAAAAGHRLGDDGRLARDVAAHEAGDQAAVIVVGAAAPEADIEIDGLALEERIGGLRRRRLRQQHSDAAANRCAQRNRMVRS